jgi:phage gpG-like protein
MATTAQFDFRPLLEAFADIEDVIAVLPIDAALVEVSHDLEVDEKGFFDSRTAPNGEPWATNWEPWADWKRKNLGHELPLKGITGNLESSMTGLTGDSVRDIDRQTSRAVLTFGTSLDYAQKMQEGGPSYFALFNQTIQVTPRPFAGFKPDRADTIAETVADAIVDAMKL